MRRDAWRVGMAAGVLLLGGAAAGAVGLNASEALAERVASVARWGVMTSVELLQRAGVDVRVEAVHADPAPRAAAHQERQDGDFSWSGAIRPGQVLEVVGVNGPITAVAASGDRAEVTATKRARHSDPAEVRIEVVEHAGGVTLCAVYPGRGNACEPGGGRNEVHDNDVQVAFEVQVPAGVRFHGRTVNGGVEVRDLDAEVAVRSVNGDVELSTSGPAEANTVNGSIRATLGSLASGLSFETVNGSIELDIPDDAGADVDARWVNGGLETDLPLRLRGAIGRHSAEGTLGEGGPRLDLTTVNGSIRIR